MTTASTEMDEHGTAGGAGKRDVTIGRLGAEQIDLLEPL